MYECMEKYVLALLLDPEGDAREEELERVGRRVITKIIHDRDKYNIDQIHQKLSVKRKRERRTLTESRC